VTAGIQPETSDAEIQQHLPSHVTMALLDLKSATMLAPGRYAFDRLERIAAKPSTPPAYFELCEAKQYDDTGYAGPLHAAVLSNVYDRPYVGTPSGSDRGPITPAFLLDTTALRLARWHDGTSRQDYPDARGLAELENRKYRQPVRRSP
jgi:hypothetical protein